MVIFMGMKVTEAHPVRDRVLRTVANQAFTQIVKKSKSVRNWKTDKAFTFFKKPEIFGFVVAIHKIIPNIPKLHLAVVPEGAGGSNHYNLEGKVIRIKAIPKKMVIDTLAGKISKARELGEVFRYCMERNKPTFIHEFTHYVDFDKRKIAKSTYGKGTSSDRAEDNKEEYLNSPEEFNAFYQSGAKQLEDMVKEALRDDHFMDIVRGDIPKKFSDFIRREFKGAGRSPLLGSQSVWPGEWLEALTPKNKRKFIKRVAPLHKWAVSKLYKNMEEAADRDYKKEYEKYQSSPEKKKYRAQLNKYNRDKGTYGNGDNKDASHKNGKIVGFEDSSKNKGRAEKSRLKGSKRKKTNEETMIKLMDLLREAGGGEAAGSMEIASTPVKKAVAYARGSKNYDEGTFEKNYNLAQKKAKMGFAKRRDMPVINISDVQKLQTRLKNGTIDIDKPFADETPERNPFPQGLSGKEAKNFLQNGIKLRDGDEKDDVVQTKMAKVALKDLKPIQKQIYFDKSWDTMIDKFGADSTKKFIENSSILISSNDNYILDGHHRFLAGMLLDPNLKAKVLKIDLPIKKLLPLLLAYGDAIGNKRNL